MARASRSSKKQPAFDPNELSDLIFSPAVGTGVGSHLLEKSLDAAAEDNTGLNSDQPTVVISDLSTVLDTATVDRFIEEKERDSDTLDLTTVDQIKESTVVTSIDQPTVDINYKTTVDRYINNCNPTPFNESVDQTTVVTSNKPTVAISDLTTVAPETSVPRIKKTVFWITENGDLVPRGRVKRIILAQDVINSAEESVYDTLWTSKSLQADDSYRLVQAGYDYLGKKTRLSKKTIQRIIAKLIDKDFIAIERPADIYQRSSTVYRVFSYKTVLDRHVHRRRSHVAKIGPGFSYVRPLDDPRVPPSNGLNLPTVAISNNHTVDRIDRPPVVNMTIETVDGFDLSTVVPESTTRIGIDVLDNPSSSGIQQALSQYGAVDDDAVRRLIRDCKRQAPDCTVEEIIHFIGEKGALVRGRESRIHSPIGFLLTAVPKCLSGDAFQLYRRQRAQQREAEDAYEAKRQAELDEWRREQEQRLADPDISDEDKAFIRDCLGMHLTGETQGREAD